MPLPIGFAVRRAPAPSRPALLALIAALGACAPAAVGPPPIHAPPPPPPGATAAPARIPPTAGPEGEAVLAEGRDVRITEGRLLAKLGELAPAVRVRYEPLERRRELLDDLIRFALLAAQARREGIEVGTDGRPLREQAQRAVARVPQGVSGLPDEEELMDKLRVQTLVQRYFSAPGRPAPSEAEARAWYEAHRGDFVRPERCRLEVYRLAAPIDPGERAAAGAAMARLRRHLAGFPPDAGDVAPPALAPTPDGAFRTLEEAEALHGAPIARAAFALASPGDVTPVLETVDTFLVAKLLTRQPALDRSWDQVREQVALRIQRERRTKEFDAYVAGLRAAAGVRVDERALDRIEVR